MGPQLQYYECNSVWICEQNGSEDGFSCQSWWMVAKSGMVAAGMAPANTGETAKLHNEDIKRLSSCQTMLTWMA